MEKTWPDKCPNCKDQNWQDEGIVDMSEDGITIEWICDGCGISIHLNWRKFEGWEKVQDSIVDLE